MGQVIVSDQSLTMGLDVDSRTSGGPGLQSRVSYSRHRIKLFNRAGCHRFLVTA